MCTSYSRPRPHPTLNIYTVCTPKENGQDHRFLSAITWFILRIAHGPWYIPQAFMPYIRITITINLIRLHRQMMYSVLVDDGSFLHHLVLFPLGSFWHPLTSPTARTQYSVQTDILSPSPHQGT